MKALSISRAFYLMLIYLFFYVPIGIVVVFSFNDSDFSLIWHGFTLRWYTMLFHDQDILTVTLHSLTVAILASTFAGVLGTLAAVILYRYKFFGKNFIHGALFVLIVVPDLVLGISFLILFHTFNLPLGFWTLLLSHIAFCMPFVAVTVYARITSLDKHIFEAAKDLAASDLTILRRIIVPLMWPAIISGWLLSFTLSIDDVIISYFVTGPTFEILPLKIFSMVKLGVKPEINALCTIILGVTFVFIIAAQLMQKRRVRG